MKTRADPLVDWKEPSCCSSHPEQHRKSRTCGRAICPTTESCASHPPAADQSRRHDSRSWPWSNRAITVVKAMASRSAWRKSWPNDSAEERLTFAALTLAASTFEPASLLARPRTTERSQSQVTPDQPTTAHNMRAHPIRDVCFAGPVPAQVTQPRLENHQVAAEGGSSPPPQTERAQMMTTAGRTISIIVVVIVVTNALPATTPATSTRSHSC